MPHRAEEWFATRRTRGRELRPRTKVQHRVLLDRYLYPTFGDERIDRSTHEDVNDWYDGVAPGHETMRAHAYSLLRTIFSSATTVRPTPLIPYNPAHIRSAGNTRRVHHVEPATLAELETIVAEMPERYWLMTLLAAWCALRFGELTELRRGDIDLRFGPVKVRRSVVRAGGAFIVGLPKTDAGSRDVAIPSAPHARRAPSSARAHRTGAGHTAVPGRLGRRATLAELMGRLGTRPRGRHALPVRGRRLRRRDRAAAVRHGQGEWPIPHPVC